MAGLPGCGPESRPVAFLPKPDISFEPQLLPLRTPPLNRAADDLVLAADVAPQFRE